MTRAPRRRSPRAAAVLLPDATAAGAGFGPRRHRAPRDQRGPAALRGGRHLRRRRHRASASSSAPPMPSASAPDAPTRSSSTPRTASTRSSSPTRSTATLRAEGYDPIVDSPESTREWAFGQLQGFFGLAYVILVVAAAAGLLGLANTLAVSVLSRTREIGMLRSVGTTRKQVRRLVLVEAITLAIVAFVLAVPLGFVINFGSAAAFKGAIGASIEPTQPWGALPVLLVLTLGVAALASLLPARRPAASNPSPPSASTDVSGASAREVVDEAGLAEADGGEEAELALPAGRPPGGCGRRPPRRSRARRAARRSMRSAISGAHLGRVALAGVDVGATRLQRGVHDRCGGPLLGGEVGVAARHGQAVGLAERGARRRPRPGSTGRAPSGGRRRPAGSPSRRSTRVHGPTMANSLATTVATPAKWVGRARPSSGSDTSATVHRRAHRAVGVHLLARRHEEQVDALALGQRGVAVEVAGVGVEVLGGRRTAAGSRRSTPPPRRCRRGRRPSATRARRGGSPSSARSPTVCPPARAASRRSRSVGDRVDGGQHSFLASSAIAS